MSYLAQGRGCGGDSAVTLRRAPAGGRSSARCGASRFLVVILGCMYFAARAGAAVRGDADCNGVLNSNDLAAVIAALTNATTCTGADANGDRQVTAADLVAEVNWLTAATPTPTSSPTASPTASPTLSPTSSPALSPTATGADTATPGPMGTATFTATLGPMGTATSTATVTVTASVTPSATVTLSPTWTLTPSTTPTISPTATVTDTPSQTPTATLTLTSSSTPTSTRTATNTVAPLPTATNTPLPTATTIPTRTPVPPPTPAEPGPQVTFFGIAKADGCFACDVECGGCYLTPSPTPVFDAQGRRVFLTSSGSGFLIVVEARPGSNRAMVGRNLDPAKPPPDLQIESTQNMGIGSAAVCDIGAGTGGIPGIPQPDFGPLASDALADFACRFTYYDPANPCTNDRYDLPSTLGPVPPSAQFCDLVALSAAFPEGDSLLTVQVADTAGMIGPTAQIVLRVVTPTPAPQ